MKIAYLGPFTCSLLLGKVESLNEKDIIKAPGQGGFGYTDLVKSMLLGNDELVVITLDENLNDEIIERRGKKCTLYCIPKRKEKRFRDFFKKERDLIQKIINKEKPDIVHAHWTFEYGLAVLQYNGAYLVTSHDHPWECLKFFGKEYLYPFLISNYVLLRAKSITAVSPTVQNYARNVLFKDLKVITNPLDPDFFETAKKYKINYNPKKIIIFSALNDSKLKNPKKAILAFKTARELYPQIEYHVFGPGLEKNGDLHNWTILNKLNHGIIFHGMVPNLRFREFLQKASIFLHPSLTEACNMGVAEAMMLGIPVIGGKKAGGIPWQLDMGNAGVLVNVKNPENIANALKSLISDPLLRERIGKEAKRRALELYDYKKICNKYKILYQNIINGKKFKT